MSKTALVLASTAALATATLAAAGTGPVSTDLLALSHRLGFSAGVRPLQVAAPDGGSLSARACAACHAEVYADWQTTRHRVAFTNAVFLDGLAREPLQRCVHCHAPLVEQRRELGPLRGRRFTAADVDETGLAHEGITCAVCHVRNGAVLVTRPVSPRDGTPMHDVIIEPALTDPAFCGACHQFGFTDSQTLMQGTWSEWQAFAAAGGQGTCQSCHMPQKRHLFRGAWDVDWLRRSVRVAITSAGLRIESVDVGHHLPSGDLFRHLSVEVTDSAADATDSNWETIARIGRRFGGVGADVHVVEDTALRPGVPRVVPLPPGARRYRLRYHYAEARHEDDGVVAPVTVAEGVIR